MRACIRLRLCYAAQASLRHAQTHAQTHADTYVPASACVCLMRRKQVSGMRQRMRKRMRTRMRRKQVSSVLRMRACRHGRRKPCMRVHTLCIRGCGCGYLKSWASATIGTEALHACAYSMHTRMRMPIPEVLGVGYYRHGSLADLEPHVVSLLAC